MLAFPGMLVNAAKAANMKVPPNPDSFNKNKFPHFDIFCKVQLCRRMEADEPSWNAEVIMKFSEKEIKKATLNDLIKKGLKIVF